MLFIELPKAAPQKVLACRLLYMLAKQNKGDRKMKYYMASYSGSVTDEMNYEIQGSGNDLFVHFPELKAIIDRYPLKTIDFRLANGDRFRIYDIIEELTS